MEIMTLMKFVFVWMRFTSRRKSASQFEGNGLDFKIGIGEWRSDGNPAAWLLFFSLEMKKVLRPQHCQKEGGVDW